MPSLAEIAAAGDDAAAASLAEMLAYLGRWDEVIVCAGRLVANPLAVYAGNVLIDMILLIGRAGHETGRWTDIAALADAAWHKVDARLTANPDGFPDTKVEGLRGSMLVPIDRLGEYALDKGRAVKHENVNLFLPVTKAPNPATYKAALKKNRGASLTRQMSFACIFRVEDEMIRLAEALDGKLQFDQAVPLARVLLRRGQPEAAWTAIERGWPEWGPVDRAQVAPVCLLTDEAVLDAMTPERCEGLLRTPRAAYLWS